MSDIIIKPFEELDRKIYGYTLPEVATHDGYVKIGETNRLVEDRIKEQVGTAGLNPKILFHRKAQKNNGDWFNDRDLHTYIENKGHHRANFAREWFFFNGNLEEAERLTDEYISLDYDEIQINDENPRYILRDEQAKCVQETYDYYKKVLGSNNDEEKKFLWNAKPRFGKTLTTYDFILKIEATNVLIVTNRPAIANSWYEDFYKFISWREPYLRFVSETDALKGKAYSREEYIDMLAIRNETAGQITFLSLQDLKGARFAGGDYDKLEWVKNIDWDLLVIDEAHEGVDTVKTDRAFDQIDRDFELHLSGTPFKALESNKFSEEQIYNWSYLDEQKSKAEWDYTQGANPYENLPTLNLFTYQMSNVVTEKLEKGLSVEERGNIDYAFDLNEFFSTKDNGKFVYEDDVLDFLDNLTEGEFPFAKEQYREELNHTFWLLPRVASAKAMEKLLKKHPVLKDYKTILAAGDGISLESESEERTDFDKDSKDFKSNEKSYDKVKKAIQNNDKTITLSVGQLTTGVTIPEWTAVFMLSNIKSPSLYFQAAFRAQNPYELEKDGKLYRKENAYVFDFAPERTLDLYSDFALNLNPTEDLNKKNNIKELLNFFPVIAEDDQGHMKELNAEEVLVLPQKLKSEEVLRQGFMSNLLFNNIYGVFRAPKEVTEILEKIPPEENKKFGQREEVEINDVFMDEDGNIDIPREITINETDDLFGDKIYKTIDIPDIDFGKIIEDKDEKQKQIHKTSRQISKEVVDQQEKSFENISEKFELNRGRTKRVEEDYKNELENKVQEPVAEYYREIEEAYIQKETKLKESKDEEEKLRIQEEYDKVEKESKEKLNKQIEEKTSQVAQETVERQIEKEEKVKKDETENQVRKHLRGFTRTIPSFLMAYGDEDTRLANFEDNIEPEVFEEITSISVEEFRKLRDGFDYVDDEGNNKKFRGLFDEAVFNASIKEFLNKKSELANYFDESLEEDIFSYIPPQQTNQIYTPRPVVEMMVDKLEEENPGIFENPDTKFVDLYAKSGLYLIEIIKRLNQGLKDQIPNDKERIKWILENQVYGVTPTKIIYNIVRNYVYGDFADQLDIKTDNIVLCDTARAAEEGILEEAVNQAFGGRELKFDVIIGNPPYQEETEGTSDRPIYNDFMDESYKLSDKVMFITPARFLFNAGKTPKKWNRKMLDDEYLKVVFYEQVSGKVFPGTDIKGGISVTYRDANKNFGKIGTFTAFEELNHILEKVVNDDFMSFNELIYAPESYRISDKFHEENPQAKDLLSKGHDYDLTTNIFDRLADYFYDEKPLDNKEYIRIYGRQKNKRVFKWVRRDYIEDHENLHAYKVFVPKSNGSGAIGEVLSTPLIGEPLIGEPLIGHTQTFISIGAFDTYKEAEAALKYVKSKFARVMLGTLKVTQHNTKATWANVPMQDFTPNSDIDWSKSIPEIDQKLYKKYGLNQEEIDFIEKNVQAME